MVDDSSSFFGSAPLNSNCKYEEKVNPLNALPPQQAMRMIDCFFCIHPFCYLLNKTLLLQSYWNDNADPLLMSVIYGTTAYYFNLFEGRSLILGETATSKDQRNSFLHYAYHLLEHADPNTTLSQYQAVVILGLFEVQYGFSKKGASLFALTRVLNCQLGVSDPEARAKMSEVEREMLIMAFWASNNCITRGFLECK
ncbi:hypothetical protein BX666DRAFT_1945001 [Dichotomocladium elegans]|nr:hypothetical protein BX666DRAFT_1945001 [Dichotomocladium elegans]